MKLVADLYDIYVCNVSESLDYWFGLMQISSWPQGGSIVQECYCLYVGSFIFSKYHLRAYYLYLFVILILCSNIKDTFVDIYIDLYFLL